ncbi:MAG: amidohydrolase, partial [Dehalococcoidia bacterium]
MTTPLPPVRDEVLALRENLIEMRRDFHQHPELSWKEERTQRVILERLHTLGLDDVRPIATTGATGVIPGAG